MRLVYLFILITTFASSYSQKVLKYSLFGKTGDTVKEYKNAFAFEKHEKINDTLFTKTYYQVNGPGIKIESYKDSKSTIKNNLFIWYNNSGNFDSLHFYYNNEILYQYNCPVSFDSTNSFEQICSPNLESILPKTELLSTSSTFNTFSIFEGDLLQFFYNNFRYPEFSKINQIH